MRKLFADVVAETTATAGTGTVTLALLAGYARFSDRFTNGDRVYYSIRDGSSWEIGKGTVGAANTLARTTVLGTLVAGVWDDTSPSAITLSGNSTVRAVAPEHLLTKLRKREMALVAISTVMAQDFDYGVQANSLTMTLPASPAVGDSVGLFQGAASITGTVVDPGAEKIHGAVGTLPITVVEFGLEFVYVDAAYGWKIIPSLQSQFVGVIKSDDNTLQLTRPLAEVQAIATDTSVTGIDAASLRLRNVYSAVGAGPNVYMEGINSVAAVKQVARIAGQFINKTTTVEESKLVLSVLKGGANVQVAFRGDSTANVSPVAVAGVGLGTQALPWLEAYVGDTGATRYVKLTSTGPATENALITEGGSLSIYNGAQATLVIAVNGLTLGSLPVAGAANIVGLTTTITATGGHSGTITGHKTVWTAQGSSGVVIGHQLSYVGASDYGYQIVATNASDDNLDYGVHIDTTVDLQVAAYFQKQKAGGAAAFALLHDSTGTVLFSVSSAGALTTRSNLIFSTTAQRITGDFSNATLSSQVMFQSSTTNGATNLGMMPNGSGTSSGITAYGGSDPVNANWFQIAATTTGVTINTDSTGSGTTQDVTFQVDGTRVMMIVAAQGDVVVGKTGLTTGATSGHIFIPAVAGAMTGVPTARTGFVPIYFDLTNNKIGCYDGAWLHSAALT